MRHCSDRKLALAHARGHGAQRVLRRCGGRAIAEQRSDRAGRRKAGRIIGDGRGAAGAARVDAVERCPAMARVCSEALRLNRMDVTLHCAGVDPWLYGTDIRYDVVVAEVVDAALFGEGCLATLADVQSGCA